MLIKFTSKTGPSVSMFENDARWMLKAMRQSGTVPSALHPDDIHTALTHLLHAVGLKQQSEEQETEAGTQTEEDSDFVSIRVRAYPLIELLKIADKNKNHVMWTFE